MMRHCIRQLLVACASISLVLTRPWPFNPEADSAWAEGGRVIRVVPDGKGHNPGLETAEICGSAASPCGSIQAALHVAQDGDIIQLAAGVYTSTGEAVVNLTNRAGLTIRGGYDPEDWTLMTDVSASATVLDGNNNHRVVFIANMAGEVRLENLVIQNGFANQRIGQWGAMGGGLLCLENASVVLRNVIIRDNVTQGLDTATVGGGGAAFLWGGEGRRCSANLFNVTFENNVVRGGDGSPRGAQALGGGLYATYSNVTGENVSFVNNQAQAGSGGAGYLGQSWDRADALGGGAAFQNNAVTLMNVVARQNRAVGGYGSRYGGFADGGGLYFERSIASVISATLRGNSVVGGSSNGEGGASGGGGLMAMGSVLTLEQMAVINNGATGGAGSDGGDAGGGGLYFSAESAAYPNRVQGNALVIADNWAEAGMGANRFGGGGGVFSQNTDLTLLHTTLARNSVLPSMRAPGLVVLNYSGSSRASVRYSIVADHRGSGAAREALFVQDPGSELALDYVLFHNNTLDLGNHNGGMVSNENPLGGDPHFVNPGSPYYDYHVGFTSAALDRAWGGPAARDIDGQPRPFGPASDVGADEAYPALASSTKSVEPTNVQVGLVAGSYPVTYTVRLVNSSHKPVSANLRDVLPQPPQSLGFSLVSLWCSSGNCYKPAGGPDTLYWSGQVPALGEVTIRYQLSLNVPANYSDRASIVNTAFYDFVDGDGVSFQGNRLSATLMVNGLTLFVPLVLR